MKETFPIGYCSKCGRWAMGGATYTPPCVFHKDQDIVPFNKKDGGAIGVLSRAAFNKHAYIGNKKVTMKDKPR